MADTDATPRQPRQPRLDLQGAGPTNRYPRADASKDSGQGQVTESTRPGGIIILQTEREMKSYSFTDSDLDAISIMNVVSTVSFAFGAGVLTFWIDVRKDLIIASSDELSVPAQALSYSVNWFGIPVAVIFIVVGVVAWIKRGGTIRRVKRESGSIAK